jgi:hypothetical protein
MRTRDVKEWKVFAVGGRQVVHVPRGRGEALRVHLLSHGITARVSPAAETPFERLELESGVDSGTVQAIIDHWAR